MPDNIDDDPVVEQLAMWFWSTNLDRDALTLARELAPLARRAVALAPTTPLAVVLDQLRTQGWPS